MQWLKRFILFNLFFCNLFLSAAQDNFVHKKTTRQQPVLELKFCQQGCRFITASKTKKIANLYKDNHGNSEALIANNSPTFDTELYPIKADTTKSRALFYTLHCFGNFNKTSQLTQRRLVHSHNLQKKVYDQTCDISQLQLNHNFLKHNLSIGKQPIVWGSINFADNLNIFGYQSDWNLENNWLGKLTWFGENSHWQVVYIPFSKSNKQQVLTQLATQPKSKKLIPSTKNSELGLRYALTLAQSDLAFYAGHLLQDDYYIFQQQLAVDRYFLFGSSANINIKHWLLRFDGAIKANIDVISNKQLLKNHLLDYAISLEYLHHKGWNINTGLQQKIFLKDTQLQINPTTKIPLYKRNVLWVVGLSKSWQSSQLNINTHIISSQRSKLFIVNTHIDYIFNNQVSIRSKLGQYFSDSDLKDPKPRTDFNLMLRYDF